MLVALAACNRGGGTSGVSTLDDGAERGPCYGNGTCDPGLVCYSDRCVRPPGADCAKVAEKLSGYRLDNYAPKDERLRVIGEIDKLCRDAQLTEDEGACITGAHGRSEIAACPRPLLPELAGDPTGCGDFGAHVTRLFFEKMVADGASRSLLAKYEVELTETLDRSCRDDGWNDTGKRCVLDATSMRDADNGCDDLIPKDVKDRVQARLEPLLDRIEREVDASRPMPPPPSP